MIAVPHFAPMHPQLVQYLLPSDEDFPGPAAKELLKKIVIVRVQIFYELKKRLAEGPASLSNLLQQPIQRLLQDDTRLMGRGRKMEEVSRGMFTIWRKRNLLRDQNGISIENIAELLITASQSTSRQAFLPTKGLDPEEPLSWVFAQHPPKEGSPSPFLPCPWPLPADLDLAKGTLLLSPWPIFDPEWETSAGPYGAVRFYQLGANQIKMWAPGLLSGKPNEYERTIIEKTLLLEKARTLLLNPDFTLFHSLDAMQLVWEKEDLFQRLGANSHR